MTTGFFSILSWRLKQMEVADWIFGLELFGNRSDFPLGPQKVSALCRWVVAANQAFSGGLDQKKTHLALNGSMRSESSRFPGITCA